MAVGEEILKGFPEKVGLSGSGALKGGWDFDVQRFGGEAWQPKEMVWSLAEVPIGDMLRGQVLISKACGI